MAVWRQLILLSAGLAALSFVLACPIQRPAVPREYYEFRARLQTAVADTAVAEMAVLPPMRDRLDSRLQELAALVRVDSLLAALAADPQLRTLSGALAAAVSRTLESGGFGGAVHKAFATPGGQRQAVDAILIGLGRALHRLREGGREGVGRMRTRHRWASRHSRGVF